MARLIESWVCRPDVILFLMAILAYGYLQPRYSFWGVNSRLALTYAIVERGTLKIDAYCDDPLYRTQDRALHGGHYYSDKIIGLSVLGIPPYWLLHNLSGTIGFNPKPLLSRYVIRFSTVSLSAAFLMVLIYRFLLVLGKPPSWSAAVALFGAFGTILFPFSMLFYPYLPVCLSLLLGLFLLCWSPKAGGARPGSGPGEAEQSREGWRVPLVGFLLGLACLLDYTATIPSILILLFDVLLSRRIQRVLAQVIFASLPLLLFAGYNWLCFGNPLSLPYSHLENTTFREGMSQGLMGVGRFQWYVLFLTTLHPYRGVFFYSPFLLLGFVGIGWAIWRGGDKRRSLACLLLAIVGYYLALNTSYYMWWGGGTLLARHLTPMVPFLILGLAWLPRRLFPLFWGLGALSLCLIVPQSVVEPHFEPFYSHADLLYPRQTVKATGKGFYPPAFRHSYREFLAGRISMNPLNRSWQPQAGMWWSLFPLLAGEIGLLWALKQSIRRVSYERVDPDRTRTMSSRPARRRRQKK